MSAFRQSVEAMIPALRRYARALARDADIADDLVQDTLVRRVAFGTAVSRRRRAGAGSTRSSPTSTRTGGDRWRGGPQFMPLLDNNPDASGTEAEGRDIARALATLVEEQRSVLLLVMLEGTELPRGRRHPGRADRHRNVPACPRAGACQSCRSKASVRRCGG